MKKNWDFQQAILSFVSATHPVSQSHKNVSRYIYKNVFFFNLLTYYYFLSSSSLLPSSQIPKFHFTQVASVHQVASLKSLLGLRLLDSSLGYNLPN